MKAPILFFWATCFCAISAAGAAAPSKATIAGNYVGSYAGGEASFELRADGTYTQSFLVRDMTPVARKSADAFGMQDGHVFTNSSTWGIQDGKIHFWNLANPFDFQRQGFPTIHTETFATWDGKNSRIVFPKEKNCWIQKVKKTKSRSSSSPTTLALYPPPTDLQPSSKQ